MFRHVLKILNSIIYCKKSKAVPQDILAPANPIPIDIDNSIPRMQLITTTYMEDKHIIFNLNYPKPH